MRKIIALLFAFLVAPAWGMSPTVRQTSTGNTPSWTFINSSYATIDCSFSRGECRAQAAGVNGVSIAETTSRASQETCTWSSGLLTYAANNVPCITDLGLQVWEGRTNLALQSQFPGGSSGNPPTSWSAFGTGFAPIASVYNAPGSAYQFTSSASRNFISQTISVSASTTYTFSALVEANSGAITIQDIINVVSLPAGASVAFPQGATTVPTAGTWLSAVLTVSGTAGTVQVRVGAGCNANVTGSVTLSAPQFEVGAFRSPYIPTTSTTAARAADNITAIGALLAIAKLPAISQIAQTYQLAGISSNRLGLDFGAKGTLGYASAATNVGIYNGSVTTVTAVGNSGNFTTGVVKAGGAFDANGDSIVANNGPVGTSANGFTTPSAVNIGSTGSASYLDGNLQRITVFNSRLPDATLKAMTQ